MSATWARPCRSSCTTAFSTFVRQLLDLTRRPVIASSQNRSSNLLRNGSALITGISTTLLGTIDSGMSHARRDKLHATLESYFGCDDTATIKLIEQAAKVVRDSVDLYHFTRRIYCFVNDERRNCIVKMMWTVLYADGIVSPLESNIVWRTADLLGVSSRHRVELRHRIAAEKRAARD
jgi:uncharacterized tellurite resistance protein B-like protein